MKMKIKYLSICALLSPFFPLQSLLQESKETTQIQKQLISGDKCEAILFLLNMHYNRKVCVCYLGHVFLIGNLNFKNNFILARHYPK